MRATTKARNMRGVGPLTIITISLLALTGCQSQQAAPPQSPSAVATSAGTNSAKPTTFPTVTPAALRPIEVPEGGFVPLGHFLVNAGMDSDRYPWVNMTTDVFVIGHGVETLSGKALFAGKEVVAESYTSIGTAKEPLIAGLIKYRRPASGLEEQKYVTVLAAIDPVKMSIIKQTEVHEEDTQGNTISVIGSNGPAVAFTTSQQSADSYFDTIETTYGYDALTGAKIWEQPGYATGAVIGAVVVIGEGKGIVPGSQNDPCSRANGIDILTGKILYTVDYADISARCNDVDLGYSHQSAFLPGQAEFLKYVRIEEANVQKSFIATTGEPVALLDQTLGVDPLTDLVVGEKAAPDTMPIVVADAKTGETKWTLEAERVRKLSASVLALYDGKLYLKTTDQNPVVDIATGETIIDNASRYPLGNIDGWTYWSDGKLEKAS